MKSFKVARYVFGSCELAISIRRPALGCVRRPRLPDTNPAIGGIKSVRRLNRQAIRVSRRDRVGIFLLPRRVFLRQAEHLAVRRQYRSVYLPALQRHRQFIIAERLLQLTDLRDRSFPELRDLTGRVRHQISVTPREIGSRAIGKNTAFFGTSTLNLITSYNSSAPRCGLPDILYRRRRSRSPSPRP